MMYVVSSIYLTKLSGTQKLNLHNWKWNFKNFFVACKTSDVTPVVIRSIAVDMVVM